MPARPQPPRDMNEKPTSKPKHHQSVASQVRARPVVHHTRNAIEAHPTMVMAALAVARYLHTTGMSIARIVHELHGLQEIVINLNGHYFNATPHLTPRPRKISPP